MGDVGDAFNELRQRQKEKRQQNRTSSADLLRDSGIEFESRNIGAHLIVQDGSEKIDFWPGTGRWITRSGKRGFGVRNLIKHIQGKPAC